jgi:glycosyltransferase involved in cell wall biosynthesis
MAVHQLLPNFVPGDAVSNHARALQRWLRSWGYSAEIFAHYAHPAVAHDCRPLHELSATRQSAVLYHYSTASAEASQSLFAARGKRALIYHNITPAHFYAPYSDALYHLLREARASLGQFRTVVGMTLGDSPYNCAEMAAAGYPNPRLLPLLVEFDLLDSQEPSTPTLKRFDDDWRNFLFVGRLAPHKRQEDVIRAFAWYNRFINRRSRLFLVGTSGGLESYACRLREVIHSLGLEDHVEFAGHASQAELVAYYRLAHIFLSMSEHEGFCVPLLEAMYHRVPIIAFAATAVPDTLGEAGILVNEKDYPMIAELACLLIEDEALRNRVIHRQQQRLAEFAPAPIALRFKRYVEELLAS